MLLEALMEVVGRAGGLEAIAEEPEEEDEEVSEEDADFESGDV